MEEQAHVRKDMKAQGSSFHRNNIPVASSALNRSISSHVFELEWRYSSDRISGSGGNIVSFRHRRGGILSLCLEISQIALAVIRSPVPSSTRNACPSR